jgi:lipopolysaccharide export system ATP-binding protein
VTDDPMRIRARKGIGYLPQEPSIFRRLTVEQNLLQSWRPRISTVPAAARGSASCSRSST